mgnify:CR=1 FL=1
MYLPFSPASSSLPYQQSLSPPDSTHQFLHRCMHSEPQRCFRLLPLRTYRRKFAHYYSASYLTLLRIRISLFEYHPNTSIHSSFMSNYSRFLQHRQITFYGTFRYRHCHRHFLSCYKRIFLNHRNDISLTIRQFSYRHITDILPTFRHALR